MFDFKELEQDVYTSGRDVNFNEFVQYVAARDENEKESFSDLDIENDLLRCQIEDLESEIALRARIASTGGEL